ncbi:acyltransferase family protein [Hydrogenophaga sp. BPS33]|uniref:acyltransferase family protein n=1 Tax=Hydrogenophaga sp. BPS33 TaxID=2651974 RepID=UPI00135AAE2D|nr:acyltransferase family protein [Hydrogenophaga sp. BPS33]
MTPALSVWMDLCRVLAALAVYVGHSSLLLVAPEGVSATWQRSADDAVTAFFVISGIVIAHTSRQRLDAGGAGHYALARLSRVYSVAIPAVLFALAVDLIGMRWDPSLYVVDWQYPRLWLHLPFHWLFLGETWFGAIQPLSMAPYWSLGYEVWYYVLFGCLLYLQGRTRQRVVVVVLLIMGPRILLLWPVWWLGVVLYRRMDRLRVTRAWAWAFMLAAMLGYGVFFLSGLRAETDAASKALYAWISRGLPSPFDPGSTVHVLSDYVMALLFALFVVGAAHCGWSFGDRGARAIRFLAGFTFTFYLIHYTLLLCAQAMGFGAPSWGIYFVTFLVVCFFTWVVAQVGELRRDRYRQWLRALARRLAPE